MLPHLEGKLGGIAINVPVPNGSNLDLCSQLKRDLTADEYGGKQQVTTLHAEGSLSAQKMMTLRGYDFASAEDMVKTIASIDE